MIEKFIELQKQLVEGARIQDQYDLNTINLIAPASPTPLKYFYNTPLSHNAIAEGLLGKRPYAGAEGFNRIEQIAVEAACTLFDAEHANVQPHSVSQANQAVYQGLLNNGDRVLAMKFNDGGHLTHGLPSNFSGRFFRFDFYGVDESGFLNYSDIAQKAADFKPKLIVCGASSYPRIIDFERLAQISKDNGAYLMADLSHPAGLVVGDRFPKPFPHCDVVTLTLDKTMLGPHGGIILSKAEIADRIDKGVHPGVQSSVPLRRIYEMAQCLLDAGTPWFRDFIDRVIKNIKVFEREFSDHEGLMITGGSDTHLMVINTLREFGLTGRDAESILEEVGILTNRQVIPGETQKPYVASGIRFGTTWITARGFTESDTKTVAEAMMANLSSPSSIKLREESKKAMLDLAKTKRSNDVWYE